MNGFYPPLGSGGGGAPTGSAGGSLTGTYPNPTIATIPSGATATTQSAADSTTKLATTAFVTTADNLKANLAGPTFTGSPVLPTGTTGITQTGGTNNTTLATTAYVDKYRPRYFANGSSNNVSETYSRNNGTTVGTCAIGATGVMLSSAIELYAGQVVTNICFRSGGTAGSVMTHWWVALYDTQATPALISQSTDQTNGAIAANTNFAIALNTNGGAQTISTSGLYYVSLMVAATTVPTLNGNNAIASGPVGGVVTGQKVLSQTSGSALTTTAPGTIASPTTVANLVYMATS